MSNATKGAAIGFAAGGFIGAGISAIYGTAKDKEEEAKEKYQLSKYLMEEKERELIDFTNTRKVLNAMRTYRTAAQQAQFINNLSLSEGVVSSGAAGLFSSTGSQISDELHFATDLFGLQSKLNNLTKATEYWGAKYQKGVQRTQKVVETTMSAVKIAASVVGGIVAGPAGVAAAGGLTSAVSDSLVDSVSGEVALMA